MPRYYPLKNMEKERRSHIVDGIFRIRENLRVPPKNLERTLLLATWNIRDFGKGKEGPRLAESLYFMAEIISRFDLVAVQEVFDDMEEFGDLLYHLGPFWRFIATDTTEGSSGNRERMVFLYDSRSISFRNIAGEIVLPKTNKILQRAQFARTPFLVAFQCGWFKFNLCTAHIYYGEDTGEKFQQRVKEIQAIAEFIEKRSKKDGDNYILLGDFNVPTQDSPTIQALRDHGFALPKELVLYSNAKKDKYYDQIAFHLREGELQLGDGKPNSGAFDYYQSVFRADEWQYYFERIRGMKDYAASFARWEKDGTTERTDAERRKQFETWRTYQMSDHLPLWVELKIDFSEPYLNRLKD